MLKRLKFKEPELKYEINGELSVHEKTYAQ
jgi:hypothetical protein